VLLAVWSALRLATTATVGALPVLCVSAQLIDPVALFGSGSRDTRPPAKSRPA